MGNERNNRILVVDDQQSILEDFRKIFGVDDDSLSLRSARAAFFGETDTRVVPPTFVVTTASQGEEGIQLVREAVAEGAPFALAFVDVRMPPGLDGVQAIREIWRNDEELQVVICTAYSDYSFEEIVAELGNSDKLLILKKPFDPVEVRQLAATLVEKWNNAREVRQRVVELELANEKAQEASRAKSQFLANMSHEIRTPMNALLGYVDLLCDPDVTKDEQRRYGEILRKSGDHLLTILNDILDISRIEASRLIVNQTSFSPAEVAREVVSLLRNQAEEKGLELSLTFDGPIPASIESDHVRVRQILLNLVGNAVKFTESGSVRMRVHLDDLGDGEERALSFDVVDTGPGIDAVHLDALFRPFCQVDGSVTREAGGAGLGLAISRRLANMLGGDVGVTSKVGEGSTFTLTLDLGAVDESRLVEYEAVSPTAARASAPAEKEPALRDLEGLRLAGHFLLVEDVRFNQILMSAILRKAGATVEVAENGARGCELLAAASREGAPHDLVLMDMQMPVLDGYEASRRMRAMGYEGPIVALTAHAMEGDRERCVAAGCTDYTTKPVDRRELLALCQRLLAEHGTPAPLPSEGRSSRLRGA